MNRYILIALAIPGVASAHRPYFADGDHVGAESAFVIEEPEISMVLYGDVSCENEQLWMTFDAEAGFPLYLQLGVPEIDRLDEFRPSMALLHPGLDEPVEALPFAVPEGFGVQVWHTPADAESDAFYEPYTQTHSWIWQEETVELLGSGQGYVVAWNPDGWTGKLWLAMGTVEDFSGVDMSEFYSWSEKVNDFHETDGSDRVEEYCEPAAEGSTGTLEEQEGCATVGQSRPSHWWIGVLGLVLIRRRDRA